MERPICPRSLDHIFMVSPNKVRKRGAFKEQSLLFDLVKVFDWIEIRKDLSHVRNYVLWDTQ